MAGIEHPTMKFSWADVDQDAPIPIFGSESCLGGTGGGEGENDADDPNPNRTAFGVDTSTLPLEGGKVDVPDIPLESRR